MHHRGPGLRLPLAAALLCLAASRGAAGQPAEIGQLETLGHWFLDPVAQNWSCAVTVPNRPSPAHCTGYPPSYNAFVQAEPVLVTKPNKSGVLTSRYYFYVNTFGQGDGPASECPGDNIGLFEATNSDSGAAGLALIYRGTVRPCDGTFWAPGTVFHDPARKAIYILSERWDEPNMGLPFKEIWLLTSPDPSPGVNDGLSFKPSRFLQTQRPDLGLISVIVRPHPTNANIWWGFLVWNGANTALHNTTPLVVDWTAQTINYQVSPGQWQSVPIGGQISETMQLPQPVITTPGTHFSYANGRWEVWVTGDGVREFVCDSHNPPCKPPTVAPCNPPTALYRQNVNPNGDLGDQTRAQHGSLASYYVVAPNFELTGPFQLISTALPTPGDYNGDFGYAVREETAGRLRVYYGSLSQTICGNRLADWPFVWSGSGIRTGLLSTTSATKFYTVAPCRVLDTRASNSPLTGQSPSLTVNVAGPRCGVPYTARAVALNITVVGATSTVSVQQSLVHSAATGTNAVSADPGSPTRAAGAVLSLQRDGTGALDLLATFGAFSGQADILVDVTGYFNF